MEFLKKNKIILIVAALIVLFVVSIALTPKDESYLKDDVTVTEWLKGASEDKYTVVTLAQTTCSHCISFKPTAKKFAEKYDIDYYWIEVDLITAEEDYNTIMELFEDFSGTPYTAVLKNGEVAGKVTGGAVEYSSLVSQIEKIGVELTTRDED